MEAFAEEKEDWLRGFLDLPNGIPSHDTLSDVMGRMDPRAFQMAFTVWARAALPGLADEQPVGRVSEASSAKTEALQSINRSVQLSY